MLTILGTFGENIYDKFLRALEYSDHEHVTKELQKTAKFTKFGRWYFAVWKAQHESTLFCTL